MDVYRDYDTRYKSFLMPMIVSILSSDAVKYTVMEYFTKRSEISLEMENDLRTAFEENGFELNEFQMLRLIIPSSFDDIVENIVFLFIQVVTKQKALTTTYQRNVTLVESEISIIEESATKDIAIILAEAKKEAQLLITDAEAYSLNVTQKAYAESYSEFMKELEITISFFYLLDNLIIYPNDLLTYLWNKHVTEVNPDSEIYITESSSP